jgi:hypothetical protein
MLADWCAHRYPQVAVEVDADDGSLRLRSSRSGRVVSLAVTYDPRHQPARSGQLLVGILDGDRWPCATISQGGLDIGVVMVGLRHPR